MDFGGVSGSGCHEFGMMGASRMWDDAGFVRRLLEQREAVPFDGGGCRGGGRLRFVVAAKKVANALAHYYSDVGRVGLMMVRYTFLYGCNCEFPVSSGRGGELGPSLAALRDSLHAFAIAFLPLGCLSNTRKLASSQGGAVPKPRDLGRLNAFWTWRFLDRILSCGSL